MVAGPTVFVVDDDEAVLDAIATMVRVAGLRFRGFTSDHQFLESYAQDEPGCLLLDARLSGSNGLDLLETLASRGIGLPVIVITGHGDVSLAVRAMKAGAIDFLEKPFKEQQLLESIQLALEADSRRRKFRSQQRDRERRYSTLTTRERQVMHLLVRGCPNKQIARQLQISTKTVEKFRARVMRKMEVGSVAELVIAAVRLGLMPSNDHNWADVGAR